MKRIVIFILVLVSIRVYSQGELAGLEKCFKYYEKTDYPEACSCCLEIYEKDKNIDALYYAAMASFETGKTGKAKKMLKRTIRESGKTEAYILLSYIYQNNDYKSRKAAKTLRKAFKKKTSSEFQTGLLGITNFFLENKNYPKALDFINYFIELDSLNKTYYFTRGFLHETMKNNRLAEENYLKCIELEPAFFDAHYNLAVLYYNQAVSTYTEAADIMDSKKYNEKVLLAEKQLQKSLPYFEKAYQINQEDEMVIEALTMIYFKLKMQKKYEEFEKLKENQ